MSKFPEAIPLPKDVILQREERQAHLLRAALTSVGLRLVIALGELIAFFYTNSYALLNDSFSHFFDFISSACLIWCIRRAHRPPDQDHPFGHGRIEPIAGLQIGSLMIITAGFLLFQECKQLILPAQAPEISMMSALIPLSAVCLLECSYRIAKRAAKKQKSNALMAEALHYRIDSLSSIFATLTLLVASYLPAYAGLIDRSGAVVIALLMGVIGIIACRKNIDELLDTVPKRSYFDKVEQAAKSVSGVLDTEKLNIQSFGPDAHVLIDVEVDPKLSIVEGHEISQKVRRAIQRSWPAVRDVIVHIEPFYPNDH